MTTAILGLLAIVLPLAVWLIRRAINKHDDPTEDQRRRYEEIDRQIAQSDQRGTNESVTDDLRRLRALRGDPGRSGDHPPPAKPDVPPKV